MPLIARLLLLSLFFASPAARSVPSYITFPSDVDWVTRRSPHFEIIYRRGQDDFALRTLKAAERAHRLLAPSFPPGPEKTYIVLADFQDSTNGYALNIPYSHMVIFASPPEASGTLAALDDWLFAVVLHEYVHILHIYPANGLWKWARFIFGPVILPVGLLPSHLHEGLATFYETELTTGGRGKSAEYRMLRRVAVDEKAWGDTFAPLDLLDGAATRWPGGVSAYFFGYQVYAELWKRKGAKGFYRLTESYSDNWPTMINAPLEEVYGTDYPGLWRAIFEKGADEARAELAAIRREGISPLRWLTDSRFAKWDVALSPDGRKAAYRAADPTLGTRMDILDLRTQKVVDTVELSGGRMDGLCWGRTVKGEWLVYAETESANHYSINVLRALSLPDKKAWRLTSGKDSLDHIKALGCSADLSRLLAYREVAGVGSVVDLAWSPTDETKRAAPSVVRRWAVPTGAWVQSALGGETGWISLRNGASTELWRWAPGAASPVKVFETSARVINLRRAGTAAELYAIADIDGRQEIWRIAPDGRQAAKVVTVVGGILSFDQRGDRFVAAAYRHGGYDIALSAGGKVPTGATSSTKPRETSSSRTAKPGSRVASLKTVKLAPARRVAEEKDGATDLEPGKLSAVEDYSPWSTLLPRSWIPSVLFVPDGIQLGFWVPGFDLSQRHSYDIIGGYDIRKPGNQPFASIDYRYRFNLASVFDVGLYYSPNYILLSSGSGFQTTYGAGLGVSTRLPGLPISWRFGLIARRTEPFGNTPANQAVGVSVTGSYAFGFDSRPLDISPRWGTRVSVTHQHFFKGFGSTDNYFRTTASLDQYLPAPWWDGHSWYLGLKAGYTEGTAFFNSYFVGGGEILFSQGRGFFLVRGFDFGLFLSRQTFNATLEYRFPIVRVDRGVGLRPVFLRRIHAALVMDTITQKGRVTGRPPFQVYFVGGGGELKSDWNFFYYLPVQLRAGVYHGYGPAGETAQVVFGLEASL